MKEIKLGKTFTDFIKQSLDDSFKIVDSDSGKLDITIHEVNKSVKNFDDRNNNIALKEDFKINFSDGYSVILKKNDKENIFTISGDLIPDMVVRENKVGEIKSVTLDSSETDNHTFAYKPYNSDPDLFTIESEDMIFHVPELDKTIDPFIEGKIDHFKNPDQKKIVIIKVGTSSLRNNSEKINYAVIQELSETIIKLEETGYSTILVSSGARGLGDAITKKYQDKNLLSQSLTAIGQSHLISIYYSVFQNYDLIPAQILLAYNDLEYKENIQKTLSDLIENKIVPIINSNDPVINSEDIDIDNDKLAAAVAKILNASHLVIVSDSGGLYDSDPNKNPNAKLLNNISEINDDILKLANSESGSGLGTGGIKSKIQAANSCLMRDAEMILINKDNISNIADIVISERDSFDGTRFKSETAKA